MTQWCVELFEVRRDTIYYREKISSRLDAVPIADELSRAALVMEPTLQRARGIVGQGVGDGEKSNACQANKKRK